MKIDYLKVNGYGKIADREVKFGNHINIIKGDNESGKSTLMSFIASILYGISRNKNGKDISNFDKYKPWNGDVFSGKIRYKLDDDEEYEVYRDFKKKTPEIFKNGKEISSEFGIDKTKGSEFFISQTGITEEMFFNTFGTQQEEVKLDKQSQNSIIQRLSNTLDTGNENISYKKTIDKINKRQLEEIGTERSSGRPINIINNKIEDLQAKISEIEEYKDRKYEIEKEKSSLEADVEENKNELELLREVKIEKEKNSLNNEKIKILDNEIDGYSAMQEERRKQIEELKEEKRNKPNYFKYVFLILAVIIAIVSIIIKRYIISSISGILLIMFIVFSVVDIKKKKNYKEQIKKYREKRERIEGDISRLEEIKNIKMAEVSNISEEVEKAEKEEKQKILEKYENRVELAKIEKILSTRYEEIVDRINEKEKELTNFKVSEKQIEVTNDDIVKNLENLVCLEEELDNMYEEKESLESKNDIYNLVKQSLDEAYEEMKENITPDFIIELQRIIEEATDGKYKTCFVDEDGIKIEIENGNYMDISRLSTGTIDLMYLALRISAAKSISNESIPIILDEAFAYYDKDRMKNMIKYLDKNTKNQIIILTCSNREKEVLEEEQIEYNLINL